MTLNACLFDIYVEKQITGDQSVCFSINAEAFVLQQEQNISGNTESLTVCSLGKQISSRCVKVSLNMSIYCFKVKRDSLGEYLKMDG